MKNVKKTKSTVTSKMDKIAEIKITNEEIEQVIVFRYLRCLVRIYMHYSKEVKCTELPCLRKPLTERKDG